MSEYVYLVASLPTLTLGGPVPCTPKEFLFRCQVVLSQEDLGEVAAVLEGRAAAGRSAAATCAAV